MKRATQLLLGAAIGLGAAAAAGPPLLPDSVQSSSVVLAALCFGAAAAMRLLRFVAIGRGRGPLRHALGGAPRHALRASRAPIGRAPDDSASAGSATFLSVAADRAAFVVVVATALLAQVRTIGPADVLGCSAVVFGGGLALGLLIVARRHAIVRSLARLAERFPGHLPARSVVASDRLLEGLAPGLRPAPALALLTGTVLAWALELVGTMQAFEAIGSPVRPSQAALVLASLHLAIAVLPAALGLGLAELLALVSTAWTPPPETVPLAGVILAHVGLAIVTTAARVVVAAGSPVRGPIDLSGAVARVGERRAIVDELIASQASGGAPWLSIVIPAYNEEKRILPTLVSIVRYLHARRIPAEVLVVDDGSRDRTAAVVRALGAEHAEVRLISQPANRGKGAAVRTGVLASKGRWVLFDDADGATPIEEVERLLCEAARGASVAIGSRALAAADVRVEKKAARVAAGRLFAFIVNLVAVPGVGDTQCGFKLFERQVADEIFSQQRLERFGFDVEILYLARRAGHRIAEVPVNWTDVGGSKVGLASGLDGFVDIFRVLWIHRWRR